MLLLAAVAVVAGGLWGLLAPPAGQDAQGPADTVAVEGGVLRVDGLADKTVGHAMAGMDMPDDVAAGMRRFAVNVTLAATGDETLHYAERDFLVSGPGVKPAVPVRSDFATGSVVAGSALSGSLTFDVPEDATTLRVAFQGGQTIALPKLETAATQGHDGAAGGGHADSHGQGH